MKILFIGGGNMSFAIISGLILNKHSIFVIDPLHLARKKILKLANKTNSMSSIEVFVDLEEFSNKNIMPSWIVLAVKPQQISAINLEIKKIMPKFISKSPLMSIVAGLSIKTLKKITKNDHIIRTMPNTPSLIKMGITGFFATKNISFKTKKQATKILSQIGQVVELPNEAMIDVVTAVSGSGPGYTFKFISALEKAAIHAGLPKAFVRKFIYTTLIGSVQLWEQSGDNSEDLVLKVASKGGTTEEALNHLDNGNFDNLIIKAIKKAKDKSRSLSLEINRQVQKHSKK